MSINPEWGGQVAFYELLYGTWLSYVLLVVMFERILKAPLAEWRYILINFVGAGAFWVNHYFQYADFWVILINVYTLWFLIIWWLCGIKPAGVRSAGWKTGAMLLAVVYTVAFIGFEQGARAVVERWSVNEFWFMLTSYIGFVAIILWRGKANNN